MNIQIRRAEKNDCKRILELVQELAEYERAPDAVTVSLQTFENAGFGENPIWWAFVAVDQESNIIQGFALYYIRFSTWKGPRMYLEDILVTESARGNGIGQLLFDRLVQEAKEKKFHGISWQVLEWNEPAIKFYQKNQASFDPEWVNCAIDL